MFQMHHENCRHLPGLRCLLWLIKNVILNNKVSFAGLYNVYVWSCCICLQCHCREGLILAKRTLYKQQRALTTVRKLIGSVKKHILNSKYQLQNRLVHLLWRCDLFYFSLMQGASLRRPNLGKERVGVHCAPSAPGLKG